MNNNVGVKGSTYANSIVGGKSGDDNRKLSGANAGSSTAGGSGASYMLFDYNGARVLPTAQSNNPSISRGGTTITNGSTNANSEVISRHSTQKIGSAVGGQLNPSSMNNSPPKDAL